MTLLNIFGLAYNFDPINTNVHAQQSNICTAQNFRPVDEENSIHGKTDRLYVVITLPRFRLVSLPDTRAHHKTGRLQFHLKETRSFDDVQNWSRRANKPCRPTLHVLG